MTRLDAIRQRAVDEGAHGALLSHLPDIRWAVGFTGSNALLVVLPETAILVTDGRYATQAAAEVQDARVEIAEKLVRQVAEWLTPGLRFVRQADALTLADAYPLDAVPGVTWVDATAFVAPLVARKTDDEIAAIARAQAITDAVFDDIRSCIKLGTTEREIAAEIVCRQLRRGAERMSFEPIVASGPNSALPHARPTDRAVQPGDVLVLDYGCVVDGYASDMTRTVVVGEASAEVRAVYDTVLRAQQAALDAARAGITTQQLDAAARSVIAENGYGDFLSSQPRPRHRTSDARMAPAVAAHRRRAPEYLRRHHRAGHLPAGSLRCADRRPRCARRYGLPQPDALAERAPRTVTRRVLVLAYYFPPLGGSGVQRVAKLLKYLPRGGWQATVVTPTPGRYVARDATLLEEVEQAGVEIVRTRSMDPSRLGSGVAGAAPYADGARAWAKTLTSTFFVPDNKLGWMPFALRAARARMRADRFDAILSTAPPYTSHLVAARLGQRSGVPILLDYRDDWIGNPRHAYPTRLHLEAHRALERYALRRAALVTAINPTIARAIANRAPEGVRVEVLPQGFDPADFDVPAAPRREGVMRFVYTGVFYDAQRPDIFLRAFAEAREQAGGEIEAVFAGLVPPYFDALVAELELGDAVCYEGYLAHPASVALLKSADVLWMTVGEVDGAGQISTSKIYEYMGSGLPILALVPDGEAADAVRAYGRSAVVPPHDVNRVRDAIVHLWQRWKAGDFVPANRPYLLAHDRIQLAQTMAQYLDEVVETHRRAGGAGR